MYADRIKELKSSAIRDILKLTARPGMISLAGGLPAPELFPLEALQESTTRVLSHYGSQALQYSITEGIVPLRQKILSNLGPVSTALTLDNVIITQGSQQALELLSKLYLDKDRVVFTENPSYLGALQAFRLFQARVTAIPSDEEGIRTDALRDALKLEKPAFLYIMTNFQNPTGVSLSIARRHELLDIAREHSLLVVEDDPYGELVFEGERMPSLYSLARGENIVSLSTFSKTIAPGLRVAFAVGSEEIIGKLALVKQGTDLQTNTLGQYIVNDYLESGKHREHIDVIRRTYGSRRDCMLAAMKRFLPSPVTWNRPRGGMFLWLAFAPAVDSKELLLRCIERNVAFVPGQEFFPDGTGTNTARLNFSNASLENIEEGIRRIGAVLQEGPAAASEPSAMIL
jgi:2-aminoadipate transaminase